MQEEVSTRDVGRPDGATVDGRRQEGCLRRGSITATMATVQMLPVLSHKPAPIFHDGGELLLQ